MSQQLSDGDGDPDGVGLALPWLRYVRHAADQVLQGGIGLREEKINGKV